MRHEEVQCPVRSCQAIRALSLNFVRAATKPTTLPRLNKWRKPLLGQYLVNVDASFVEEDNAGSRGTVIRDNNGMFVAAATAKLEHVADVISVEPGELEEDIKLAGNLGLNSILIQSDNVIIVEAL